MRTASVFGVVLGSSVALASLLAAAAPDQPSGVRPTTSSSVGAPSPAGSSGHTAPSSSASAHPPRVPLWEQTPLAGEAPRSSLSRRVVIDRIVALVGHDAITLSELRRRTAVAERALKSTAASPRPTKSLEAQTLDQIIEEILVANVASKKKLVVSESEIDAAVEQVQKSNHLTREALLKSLADALFTEESYRLELRRQVLRYKVLQAVIVPRTKSSPGISTEEWGRRLEAELKVWLAEQQRESYVEVRL